MRLFRLTALLATSCLLSACATAPHAKTIGGAVLATTGVVVAIQRADAHCEPQSDLCDAIIADPINTAANVFTTVVGLGMVMLGGGLMISGMRDFEVERDAKRAAELQVEAMPPPAPPLPMQPTALTATEVPARTDRLEDRLAVQAVLIAREGNCTSAIVTANELAKRDPAMFARLRAGDADLAACYAENPLSP